jgi:catechol 2,3-dioxygenase-like lactoylglutathione lyase family enzyme
MSLLSLTGVNTSVIVDVSTFIDCTGRFQMPRVQLALNVTNLDEAVSFYSKLFASEPAKLRSGYANFAIADPPLKLVLIEDPAEEAGSLNHLGVEVETAAEVAAATQRLAAAGLVTTVEEGVTCCYAVQDKVWVFGPGGEPWEVYTVFDDAEMTGTHAGARLSDAGCCVSRPDLAGHASSPPCC